MSPDPNEKRPAHTLIWRALIVVSVSGVRDKIPAKRIQALVAFWGFLVPSSWTIFYWLLLSM